MNKIFRNKVVAAISAIIVLAAIFAVIILGGNEPEKKDKVKIGFIMSGAAKEEGWNGLHYKGVKAACDKLGVELLLKENIKEFTGACGTAIEELAEDEAGMILLSSYGYSAEVIDVVKKYPDIVFNASSTDYHCKNMTSYFVRMYQARYLAGIIAGMRTKSGNIGYVAAMPNHEVNRGISAFTLGVKRVNKDATVTVVWTNSWDNKEAEEKAAKNLIEKVGVDVITYHQNQSYVIDVAEEAGIESIGYHEVCGEKSANCLTTVICNWELAYEEVIRNYLKGKGNSIPNYWIGIDKGVVGLAEYSEKVTADIQQQVQLAKNEMLSGKDVFSGVIYDTAGRLRCAENEKISDEILLEHFDWYVEGVKFYEE